MKIISGGESGKEEWDGFIKENSRDFGFLQSWDWGEFQKSLGKDIFRLAVLEKEILGAVLIIKQKLPLNKNYLYSPRGPILKEKKLFSFLREEVKKIAKKEKAIFWRLDPAGKEIFPGLEFAGQVQPKQTLILDLTKSEERLLEEMKPKTRYNIKVAERHDMEIDEGREYFEDFWRLMKKTSQRDRFVSYSREYYLKMSDFMEIMVAKYEDKVIAANLTVFFGDWCVYLHGASDYDFRDKMAPYLLQWETIIKAKKEGKKHYDFWGVDEKKWPGVTRFKAGFSPQTEFTEYAGAWDEAYSNFWHGLYKSVKRP